MFEVPKLKMNKGAKAMTRVMQTCCSLAERIRKCLHSPCSTEAIIPLARLCRSGKFTICKVHGDRKLCARIGALGIFPGAEGELLCPKNGSQCVLRIHGGSICIDSSIAEHILVTES